jgi:hypothetical protein
MRSENDLYAYDRCSVVQNQGSSHYSLLASMKHHLRMHAAGAPSTQHHSAGLPSSARCAPPPVDTLPRFRHGTASRLLYPLPGPRGNKTCLGMAAHNPLKQGMCGPVRPVATSFDSTNSATLTEWALPLIRAGKKSNRSTCHKCSKSHSAKRSIIRQSLVRATRRPLPAASGVPLHNHPSAAPRCLRLHEPHLSRHARQMSEIPR